MEDSNASTAAMPMLQRAALAAITNYQGLKAAARLLKIDPGSLSRVARGKRLDVPEHVAKKLGVKRIVTFEALPGKVFP